MYTALWNKRKYLLFVLILLLPFCAVGAMEQPQSRDLMQNIDYTAAFKQDDLFEKYKSLMEQWGCVDNVATPSYAQVSRSAPGIMQKLLSCGKQSVGAVVVNENDNYETLARKFKIECLSRLAAARRSALLQPMRSAGAQIGLTAAVTAGTAALLGADSVGSSFTLSAAVWSVSHGLKKICSSLIALRNQPVCPLLDSLEQKFAENQCFIPRDLWPLIIEKFSRARTNPFEAQASCNFLQFALSFTYYKPKPALDKLDIAVVYQQLQKRIDAFFEDYEVKPEDIDTLKMSIYTFIQQLVQGCSQNSRYQHLVGPGGIGKTHFARQLCAWLEELIPGSIHFENVIIHSPTELEGSAEQPGTYLRILRNQLQSNKKGVVIFMDEATWLNQMPSEAKRVLNGNLAEIKTHYFGDGFDGTGVKLQLPPMLIFVASNEALTDDALRSRFDVTQFPLPKRSALVRYAQKLTENNPFFKKAYTVELLAAIERAITENGAIKTFRDIEAFTGPALMRHLRQIPAS